MLSEHQLLHELVVTLQQRTGSGLPGFEAHRHMMHLRLSKAFEAPAAARPAAVMICLFETSSGPHFVLIERNSSNPHDRHGGQISLPGGKQDATDASLWHTAVRETHEETGIAAQDISFVAQLSSLYIPVSNFLVHPFVGLLTRQPQFRPDPREVTALLPTPLHWLFDPSRKRVADLPAKAYNRVLPSVPFFDFHGRQVWGATAMILYELKVLIDTQPPTGKI